MPFIPRIPWFVEEWILDALFDFFSLDAIGNLALLLSAIIGVGGSYILFRLREKRRQERIENGIRTEIEEMNCISSLQNNIESSDADPPSERIPSGSLPNANEMSTLIFDANADEIARLDRETASVVISFYSDVKVYRDLISSIKEDEKRIQKKGEEESQFMVPVDQHKELYDASGELEEQRQKALQKLSK